MWGEKEGQGTQGSWKRTQAWRWAPGCERVVAVLLLAPILAPHLVS